MQYTCTRLVGMSCLTFTVHNSHMSEKFIAPRDPRDRLLPLHKVTKNSPKCFFISKSIFMYCKWKAVKTFSHEIFVLPTNTDVSNDSRSYDLFIHCSNNYTMYTCILSLLTLPWTFSDKHTLPIFAKWTIILFRILPTTTFVICTTFEMCSA